MRLGVKDVAQSLGVDEKTIFEWVDRNRLPATRVDGLFRFNPAAVYEWATARGMRILGNLFLEGGAALPRAPLVRSMRAGGIVTGLRGNDKDAILRSAVERLELPAHADRKVILDMLLARERLGSTAIGEGFAIPHVRNPIILRVASALVTLFLLDHPIEFGAGESRPVHSLFLVITPTIQSHLVILSRLSSVLHDAGVRRAIIERSPVAAILAKIERAESKLDAVPEGE